MNTQHSHWMLIADGNEGRLCNVKRVEGGRVHVTEIDTIKNKNIPHDQDRRSTLTKGHAQSQSKRAYIYAGEDRENEEMNTMFAKDLVKWTEQRALVHEIKDIHVFAPAKLLGQLRHDWTKSFSLRVHDDAKELAGLTAGELADHQAVRALLPDEAPTQHH